MKNMVVNFHIKHDIPEIIEDSIIMLSCGSVMLSLETLPNQISTCNIILEILVYHHSWKEKCMTIIGMNF